MKTLVDTNILLRATQPHHPMSQVAIQSVKNLLAAGKDVCVFNQSCKVSVKSESDWSASVSLAASACHAARVMW